MTVIFFDMHRARASRMAAWTQHANCDRISLDVEELMGDSRSGSTGNCRRRLLDEGWPIGQVDLYAVLVDVASSRAAP